MQSEFEALLARHRVVIERYVHYRMANTFDAEDVLQETYMAAFSQFGGLRDKSAFKPWILAIARNQCNYRYRQIYREAAVSLEAVAETPEAEEPSYDEVVTNVLKRLPVEAAKLLALVMDGYRYAEIARMLKIPVGTVKSRVHHAKAQFRALCPSDVRSDYERRRKKMKENQFLHGFPREIPAITIRKKNIPFPTVRCEEECFIIPRVGNRNSEGTYRFGALALVSTCHVPKEALIHEVRGVKICRDTYNIRAGRLYKNENVWYSQLTEEYIRNLATVRFDEEEDGEYPTVINTFLEESYDVITNGNDRVHGRPIEIAENPIAEEDGKLSDAVYHVRYTMGVHEITIGKRGFTAIKTLTAHRDYLEETYIDLDGRMLLMRWYESDSSIDKNGIYPEQTKEKIKQNPALSVNGVPFFFVEDRISEYAL